MSGFAQEPTDPQIRLLRRRRSDSGDWLRRVPLWVKVLVGVAITGTVPAGVASMLPFETKEQAMAMQAKNDEAHDKIDEKLERLQREVLELPLKVIEALDERDSRRRRR